MQEIIQRFWGFDKLIGPVLVKIIYYFTAAMIILAVVGGFFMALMSLIGGNLSGALMQIIAYPAVGLVALVYWRFLCELFLIAFSAHERLVEIRDRLSAPAQHVPPNTAASPAPSDYPQF